ncbi:uncharacterized protein LOC133928139 [Phragmites australis]|uniref:uncharacterized protein LOC133928139 n=1 Tax=Phragmites australis TaxID=29695 RepID=UPI002D7A327B|nr:uncharacterized protein LOC133928139 [Phragmites australis]
MAYRRKQGIQRSATFVEDHRQPSSGGSASPAIASPRATRFADDNRRPDRSSHLAAQGMLASSAARGGQLPAFAERRPAPASLVDDPPSDPAQAQDPVTQLYTSTRLLNDDGPKYDLELSRRDDAKHGFWGLVAQKAKVMLDENGTPRDTQVTTLKPEEVASASSYPTWLRKPKFERRSDDAVFGFRFPSISPRVILLSVCNVACCCSLQFDLCFPVLPGAQFQPSQSRWSYDRVRSSESPASQKGSKGRLDIGGKIKNALEEGLTVAESKAGGGSDVVVARRLQIRRKACSMDLRGTNLSLASPDMSPMLSDSESPQIKASRDVANAMAAKVKLLQRELKTVKADLAFSKERCAQLEEENRLLRGGNHDADEDLIRQQLETLLVEKARLANENTVYARENRFLREIVEYHQLNMQDVVNLDDDIEEEDEYEGEVEAEQYGDFLTSSPSHRVQETEYLPAGPGTAPQSPSRHTESPRMLSTNSGSTVDNKSPRILSTNSGGTIDNESPMRRSFKDDGSSPETTSDG